MYTELQICPEFPADAAGVKRELKPDRLAGLTGRERVKGHTETLVRVYKNNNNNSNNNKNNSNDNNSNNNNNNNNNNDNNNNNNNNVYLPDHGP
ncbi:hypothetical protein PoB_001784900 [Plakobranchus ocellatus]|uniref:Uncharacterized protein n=1 Tax=Plakobranchus ocellatus TaxID=259542 RepID=A0AAV3ZBK7_9GAST|nr:hypothetical protein PoB_001784900 [Plakobranchus ocellatus]